MYGNKYILSNIYPKKGVAFEPSNHVKMNISNVEIDSPIKNLTEKGTYKGIIKVKNTDPNVQGEF